MPLPVLSHIAAVSHLSAAAPLVFSMPGLDGGLLRLLGVVGAAWLTLIGAWLVALMSAHRARSRARDERIEEGRTTLIDVIDLMRDKVDGTGTPYWPQRALLGDRLVTDDVPLLAAWVQSGQPLPLFATFKHAGYTGDQIARHLSGVAPLDVATAGMLATLRRPGAA